MEPTPAGTPADSTARRAHWDGRYVAAGAEGVSWYEESPATSLDILERVTAPPRCSVIDVGGGASALAEHLVARGCDDVTVLDVSPAALDAGAARMSDPTAVTRIHADLLAWEPPRRWQVWHDRAVFHFLTDPADRATYRRTLVAALDPGGAAVVATFAPDGPDTCSGLPVARYSAEELADELFGGFTVVERRRSVHVTPGGATQPFTWVVARRPA